MLYVSLKVEKGTLTHINQTRVAIAITASKYLIDDCINFEITNNGKGAMKS